MEERLQFRAMNPTRDHDAAEARLREAGVEVTNGGKKKRKKKREWSWEKRGEVGFRETEEEEEERQKLGEAEAEQERGAEEKRKAEEERMAEDGMRFGSALRAAEQEDDEFEEKVRARADQDASILPVLYAHSALGMGDDGWPGTMPVDINDTNWVIGVSRSYSHNLARLRGQHIADSKAVAMQFLRTFL